MEWINKHWRMIFLFTGAVLCFGFGLNEAGVALMAVGSIVG